MAKQQIDMSSVSLPSVPKPNVQNANAGFDYNDSGSKKRRTQMMAEMPDIEGVETSESQTSAGRLNQMLQSDSPLMQQAATQGEQAANRRGLLNSSMAAGASQGAMIERAQPFALQDSNNLMQNARQNADAQNQQNMLQSSTLADSFLQNQQFQQQGALQQQDYDIRSGLQEQQSGLQAQRDAQQFNYESGLIGQQADIQAARDERVAQLDQEQTRLQADLAEARAQNDLGREQQLLEQQAQIQTERDNLLFEQDLDVTAQKYDRELDLIEERGRQQLEELYGTSVANSWGAMSNNVGDIQRQAAAQISAVQNNPNIESGDKSQMIDDIIADRNSDINFQTDLYTDFPQYLDGIDVFPNR